MKYGMSEVRRNILDSLSVADDNGMTRDELIAADRLIPDKSTRHSYGTSIGHLLAEGIITEQYSRFFLTEAIAKKPGAKGGAAGEPLHLQNGARTMPDKTKLPEIARHRTGHTVLLYTSPAEYDHVGRVEYCVGGNWFRSPITGSMRICLGPDIPHWSTEQETNRGIKAIRIIALDGKTDEIDTNPAFPITIAPGENP